MRLCEMLAIAYFNPPAPTDASAKSASSSQTYGNRVPNAKTTRLLFLSEVCRFHTSSKLIPNRMSSVTTSNTATAVAWANKLEHCCPYTLHGADRSHLSATRNAETKPKTRQDASKEQHDRCLAGIDREDVKDDCRETELLLVSLIHGIHGRHHLQAHLLHSIDRSIAQKSYRSAEPAVDLRKYYSGLDY